MGLALVGAIVAVGTGAAGVGARAGSSDDIAVANVDNGAGAGSGVEGDTDIAADFGAGASTSADATSGADEGGAGWATASGVAGALPKLVGSTMQSVGCGGARGTTVADPNGEAGGTRRDVSAVMPATSSPVLDRTVPLANPWGEAIVRPMLAVLGTPSAPSSASAKPGAAAVAAPSMPSGVPKEPGRVAAAVVVIRILVPEAQRPHGSL